MAVEVADVVETEVVQHQHVPVGARELVRQMPRHVPIHLDRVLQWDGTRAEEGAATGAGAEAGAVTGAGAEAGAATGAGAEAGAATGVDAEERAVTGGRVGQTLSCTAGCCAMPRTLTKKDVVPSARSKVSGNRRSHVSSP